MEVFGLSGQRYQLEDKPSLGSGGEGAVYLINGVADRVVKIYHPGVTSHELEEKLKLMSGNPPSSSILNQVAWPIDVVYDGNRAFRGFVMPKLLINAELNKIYSYPPETNITFRERLVIAQNICAVISEVHRAGYIFGDFNPRNIGVDINTGLVAFLDTDSYHIIVDKSTNKAYRCNVCAPGYAAPELLEKCMNHKSLHPEDAKDLYAKTPLDTFTKETDYFALAIHVFRLLMNGFTPFGGIKEYESSSVGSPGIGDQAVIDDHYCFKPGLKPQAVAIPRLDEIPQEIADLFTRAFMYGRIDPKQRPDAVEWYKALQNYENDLKVCSKNPAHMYMSSLSSCPWCEADDRFIQATKPRIKQRTIVNPIRITPPTSIITPPPPPPPTPPSLFTKYLKWIGIGIAVLALISMFRSCFDRPEPKPVPGSYEEEEDIAITYEELDIPSIPERVVEASGASIRTETGNMKSSGDYDTYSLKPGRSGVYRFELSGIRNDNYVVMQLFDPNGHEENISYARNGQGFRADLKKTENKYKIKIHYGSGSTPYTLTIGKPKKTIDLTNVTLLKDSIEYEDQRNSYEFTAPFDGTYSFEMSEIREGGYAVMYLYNDLGEELNYCYARNGDGITIKDAKKGKKYNLYIMYGDIISPYEIKVCCQKEPVDISDFDIVNDSLEFMDQDNVYYYTPSTDGNYDVTFFNMINNAEVGLLVYNRLGEKIYSYGYLSNGEEDTLYDMNAGETYEIHVRNTGNVTPYSLLIQ